MDQSEIVEILAGSTLFGTLDPATLDWVARHMRIQRVPKGRTIIVQGEFGDRMYVVAQGVVRVVKESDRGERLELARRNPGSTFGELAMIDGGPRSATVESVNDVTVLSLQREAFMELAHTTPAFIEPIMSMLSNMIRETSGRESDQAFYDLKERVARKLLDLTAGPGAPEHLTDQHRVSQSEIAQMVTAARQRVNMALRSLVQDGCIRSDATGIEILDRSALERIARR